MPKSKDPNRPQAAARNRRQAGADEDADADLGAGKLKDERWMDLRQIPL